MAGMPEHAHHGAPELRRSAASSWQIAFQLSQLPGMYQRGRLAALPGIRVNGGVVKVASGSEPVRCGR